MEDNQDDYFEHTLPSKPNTHLTTKINSLQNDNENILMNLTNHNRDDHDNNLPQHAVSLVVKWSLLLGVVLV